MTSRQTTIASLTIALLLSAGGVANAQSYTTIKSPPGAEPSHRRAMQTTFGGTWTSQGSRDFTNGTLTAVRVADAGRPTPLSLLSSTATSNSDQLWSSPTTSVLMVATVKAAADNSRFGWIDDSAPGGAFQSIVNTGQLNVPVSFNLSGNFRWALRNDSMNTLFTSRESDNVSGNKSYDQLVTYAIIGGQSTQWLICWEDRIAHADYDYNDAFILISVGANIPAPGSAALALGGLAIAGRRERRRVAN